MKIRSYCLQRDCWLCLGLAGFGQFFGSPDSLQQQNEILFRQLQRVHGLSDDQINAIRKIFAKSGYIGQGNPAITQHPMTPEESQAKVNGSGSELRESQI